MWASRVYGPINHSIKFDITRRASPFWSGSVSVGNTIRSFEKYHQVFPLSVANVWTFNSIYLKLLNLKCIFFRLWIRENGRACLSLFFYCLSAQKFPRFPSHLPWRRGRVGFFKYVLPKPLPIIFNSKHEGNICFLQILLFHLEFGVLQIAGK